MNAMLPVLATAVLSAYTMGATPINVWLDVDPANGIGEVDDGLAMIQAFHSPELKIHGISIVFGNAPQNNAYPIGLNIARSFGPPGLTVAAGASSADELGTETPATQALAAALVKTPLTILALGPVTNVATLVKSRPDLHDRIEQIIVVAGRREGQKFIASETQAVPFRDFNFELDPTAMQVLLDSNIPLVFAPWEISSKVWLSRSDIAALAGKSVAGSFIYSTTHHWLERWEKGVGPRGFNPFDTLAIAYLTHPKAIQSDRLAMRIENAADDNPKNTAKEKPYLIVRAGNTGRMVTYCHTPGEEFKSILLQRLVAQVEFNAQLQQAMSQPARVDHSPLNELLTKYVDQEGLVNYVALRRDEKTLDRYIQSLATVNLEQLERDEHLALLINAYNACTLRLILDYYPVQSIMDIPEAKRWKHVRWNIGRNHWSLDNIEHDQIRKLFADEPRIHFALVCAAIDCPPLRSEAYEPAELERQLHSQTELMHQRPKYYQYDKQRNVLKVTSLYQWYGKDFLTVEPSVLAFIARYSRDVKEAMTGGKSPSIEYLRYDWALNEQRRQ